MISRLDQIMVSTLSGRHSLWPARMVSSNQ